jgi:hypothetical protein
MPTRNLKDSHLWKGAMYGPGENVEVPEDFPKKLKGSDAEEGGVAGDVFSTSQHATGFAPRVAAGDETDPRSTAEEERSGPAQDAADASIEAAARRTAGAVGTATGDRDGAAVTGLDTVTHPEQGHGDPRTFRETRPPGVIPGAAPRRVATGRPQGDAPAVRGVGLAEVPSPDGGRTIAPQQPAGTGATGLSREALADLPKSDLEEMARERGIEVKRGDGQDGEPLKDDYINALAAK